MRLLVRSARIHFVVVCGIDGSKVWCVNGERLIYSGRTLSQAAGNCFDDFRQVGD